MAAREVTQFSMVEALAFAKALQQPKSPREQHLADFAAHVAKQGDAAFAPHGGVDNIQRVRVLQDGDKVSYEYALKLPLDILERKRREAEREKRKQEVLAKAKELAADPKKLEEFVNKVAAAIIGRALAFELLKAAKKGGKLPTSVKARPEQRGPRKPLTKDDIWKRAQSQDRRNRIEASKAAAQEYHAAHPKPAKNTAPVEAR